MGVHTATSVMPGASPVCSAAAKTHYNRIGHAGNHWEHRRCAMQTFDYVIVGAGTAGCVLAQRLSARSRNRVLLLEAGGSDQRLWIRVPIGYGRTFNDPRVNWMYET
jgi:hypothetical protein